MRNMERTREEDRCVVRRDVGYILSADLSAITTVFFFRKNLTVSISDSTYKSRHHVKQKVHERTQRLDIKNANIKGLFGTAYNSFFFLPNIPF